MAATISDTTRVAPAFATCITSAINDAYEISFVGVIEFLERALEDYASLQALLPSAAEGSHSRYCSTALSAMLKSQPPPIAIDYSTVTEEGSSGTKKVKCSISTCQQGQQPYTSRCHIGVSFNAGKDSMVMLHLVLNAIEHIVEVGDWICERYGGHCKVSNSTGTVPTLVKCQHIARYLEWRQVFVGEAPLDSNSQLIATEDCASILINGAKLKGRKGILNPCDSDLLSFLFSHLCIFYFEDKDEIQEMKGFIEALLGGLDLPIFEMDTDGSLRKMASPSDNSQWTPNKAAVTSPCNNSSTLPGEAADSTFVSIDTAALPPTGCQRFHSRHHHKKCRLHNDVMRSPVASGAPEFHSHNMWGSQSQTPTSHLTFPLTESSNTDQFGSTASVLYLGTKVIRVSEGAGMIDGLRLLKEHFHVHHAFLGVRCDDIVGWRQEPIEMTSKGWPSLLRLCPIFSWSYEQVWMYLFMNDVPFCSLYSMGITSCGPASRTVRNPSCCLLVDRHALDEAMQAQQPNPLATTKTIAELHKNNVFSSANHSTHPNDPKTGATTIGGHGTPITINEMWPMVQGCPSGPVKLPTSRSDAPHLNILPPTGVPVNELHQCWREWWNRPQAAHAPTHSFLLLTDVVTAGWDPTEVDLNAYHLCLNRTPGGSNDPYSNPYLVAFASKDSSVSDEPSASHYIPYCVPAWLLRDGSAERLSRLPALKKANTL